MISSAQFQQLKTVLLMPVEVTTDVDTIFKYKDKIYSSQTYKSGLDQDMSDLAIGYYECIYGKLLHECGVLKQGKIADVNFAGDTMNTGIYEKKSRFKTRLEERHCLANFWLIPVKDGRKKEKPKRDYMDVYLPVVEKCIEQKDKKFQKFKSFDDFRRIHYIPEQVLSRTLENQNEFLNDRAELISRSEDAVILWEYFNRLNLF